MDYLMDQGGNGGMAATASEMTVLFRIPTNQKTAFWSALGNISHAQEDRPRAFEIICSRLFGIGSIETALLV